MAFESYVEVVGEIQNQFPGETFRGGHKEKNRSPVLRVEYSMYRPRDLQKNQFTNEAIQRPFKFVKEVGGITPLIHKAICTGEALKTITFRTFRMNPKGKMEPFFTITLEDARFTSQSIMTGTPDEGMEYTTKGLGDTDTMELEVVEAHYRKITIRNEVHGNEEIHDWNAPTIKT